MIPITIVEPYPPRACRPARDLEELMAGGRLDHFVAAASAPELDGLGNCHEICLSLMADLALAGAGAGWRWASGQCQPFGSGDAVAHSWLEADGWALDVIGGLAMFADRLWYRRLQEAQNVKLRDFAATVLWLEERVAGIAPAEAVSGELGLSAGLAARRRG